MASLFSSPLYSNKILSCFSGPSELEVRKNKDQSSNAVEPSSPSSEDVKESVSNKKIQQAGIDWEWEVAGIVPLIAGAVAGGVLIVVLTVVLIRHKVRRSQGGGTNQALDSDDNNSHSHCQSSSASMLFHSRHSEVSFACDKREHQVGGWLLVVSGWLLMVSGSWFVVGGCG